jgi:hypothetical protein
LAKGVGGLTEGRTQYRVCGLFIEEKIFADGKSSENQATSGFAGIKAPKTHTFRQRLELAAGIFIIIFKRIDTETLKGSQ